MVKPRVVRPTRKIISSRKKPAESASSPDEEQIEPGDGPDVQDLTEQ
jgi:hypothetical protein